MKTSNSFRPQIVGLEDRAMMSVTPTVAIPAEPMRIELENVFVSSVQHSDANQHGGWDLIVLSKKFTDEAQTGVTKVGAGQLEFTANRDEASGNDFYQKYLGRTPSATGYAISLEDALISSATVPTAQTREHILLARQVGLATPEQHGAFDGDSNGGSASGFHRLFGDTNGNLANEVVEGATAKATLYGRKSGDDKRD